MTIIQLVNLFFASLSKPEKLINAISLKKGKIFLYILLLAFISALPSFATSYQILKEFNQDGQTIVHKVPEFEVKDAKFVPKENVKSFTEKTDSIVFVYNPEGTLSDVEDTLNERLLGIGLLKDGLYFANPSRPIHLTFQQLDGATNTVFTDILSSLKQLSVFIIVFSFIVLFFSSFLTTLLYNLFYAIFANLVTALTRRKIPFGKVWTIVLFASTLPTLVFTIFNLCGLQINLQMEFTAIIAVYLYYLAIRAVPKMTL